METAVFIDTNVLLDFYRYPQGSAALKMLEQIDKNHNKIITGDQVEMEYKKNRQKVILEALKSLQGPAWDNFKLPVVLSEAKPSQVINKCKEDIKKQCKRLQSRCKAFIENPNTNDMVYKTTQDLFRADSDLNLSRNKKVRFTMRHLARKRFILGYPPRKDDDICVGDSINWEWIIHCAKTFDKNIVIVSRDSDYGCRINEQMYLNDWLRQEFKERVSKKRNIILTNKLTFAFKQASIPVNKQEEDDEQALLQAKKVVWRPVINDFDISKLNENELAELNVELLNFLKHK
jgi:predicted nucleic acid-binding protein